MSEHVFDDEILMAFVDGETDASTTARIRQAQATDPDIADRIALFRTTRERTAQAFGPLSSAPVPDALRVAVEAMIARAAEDAAPPAKSASVIDFARGRPSSTRTVRPWWMQAAATVLLVVGAAGGYMIGWSLAGDGSEQEFAAIRDPAIIRALSEIPSGGEIDLSKTGRRLQAVLSFQLDDGTLCREYKLREANAKGVVAIACHEQNRWQTHLLMAATRAEENYEPAGAAETIDAYMESIHAGQPLDGSAEEQALKSIRRHM